MIFKKGVIFLMFLMVVRDCINVIGMMKKKVRKKKVIFIVNFFIVKEIYGIVRFG